MPSSSKVTAGYGDRFCGDMQLDESFIMYDGQGVAESQAAEDIRIQLSALSVRITDLSAMITNGRGSTFTFLQSLGRKDIEIVKPIPVTILPDGQEFIASFFDANISTGGDTPQKAVSNLQSLIAEFFEDTENTPDNQLGPSMRRQRQVLLEMVCRTS